MNIDLRPVQVECVRQCLMYLRHACRSGASSEYLEGLSKRDLIRQLNEIIPLLVTEKTIDVAGDTHNPDATQAG